MTDEIQAFLDRVASGAEAPFQETVQGIADDYRLIGLLSDKQRRVIHISASRQKIAEPLEFLSLCGLKEQHRPPKSETKEPQNDPLATMLYEIADVIRRFADTIA